MSENSPADPWSDLISHLGVPTQPDAPPSGTEPSQPLPIPSNRPATKPTATPKSLPTANWSELALELGLQVTMPDPASAPVASAPEVTPGGESQSQILRMVRGEDTRPSIDEVGSRPRQRSSERDSSRGPSRGEETPSRARRDRATSGEEYPFSETHGDRGERGPRTERGEQRERGESRPPRREGERSDRTRGEDRSRSRGTGDSSREASMDRPRGDADPRGERGDRASRGEPSGRGPRDRSGAEGGGRNRGSDPRAGHPERTESTRRQENAKRGEDRPGRSRERDDRGRDTRGQKAHQSPQARIDDPQVSYPQSAYPREETPPTGQSPFAWDSDPAGEYPAYTGKSPYQDIEPPTSDDSHDSISAAEDLCPTEDEFEEELATPDYSPRAEDAPPPRSITSATRELWGEESSTAARSPWDVFNLIDDKIGGPPLPKPQPGFEREEPRRKFVEDADDIDDPVDPDAPGKDFGGQRSSGAGDYPESRGGGRRRRGRDRGGKRTDAGFRGENPPPPRGPVPEEPILAELVPESGVDRPLAGDAADDFGPDKKSGSRRRRRRKRKGDRPEKSASAGNVSSPRGGGDVDAAIEDGYDIDFDRDPRVPRSPAEGGGRSRRPVDAGTGRDSGDDHADEDGDDEPLRNVHRDVVPWKEAVGILVSLNMESRARSPRGERGDYRRGGRGPRGSRD
ncbi:MAG: hypothetical protein SFX18_09550 [Pirellulales bacterium]|nr:hypothetical protein [Pirellulales bacterium]